MPNRRLMLVYLLLLVPLMIAPGSTVGISTAAQAEHAAGRGSASLSATSAERVYLPVLWSPPTIADLEREVARLINEERTSRGLAALEWHRALAAAAKLHSEDMAANGFCGHVGSDGSSCQDRLLRAGYDDYWTYGEIVAAGYGASPERVVAAWMDSEDHQRIILEPAFVHLGVGLADCARGRDYWTVDFGAPR